MLHLIVLRLIPRPLHRIAYRTAHWLRTRWWRIARPRLTGCRILALDTEGHVLLVRHSYGSPRWMLPGGGVARGEDPIDAAVRELAEEAGCRFLAPRRIAQIEETIFGARVSAHVIAGETDDAPAVDGREIVEARFFAADALPDDMPASLRGYLPGWLTAARAGRPACPAPDPSLPPSPIA